jgi:hypothetical protein
MYGDRRTFEFIEGLRNFGDVARENIQNGFMCCPCVDCGNKKEYSSWKILHSHLLRKGFMPSYNCWIKHGERGVIMEDNEEEENDDMYPEYGDTATGEKLKLTGQEKLKMKRHQMSLMMIFVQPSLMHTEKQKV